MSGLGTPPAAGLVLTLNGANDLPITNNGGFTFPSIANLTTGTAYAVAIKNPPAGKTCSVSAGTGIVGTAPVSNIVVNCEGGQFTIGGAVTGLAAGASVVLTNNSGDDLTVSDGNPFAFPTTVGNGSAYNVQVKTQPSNPAQSCSVSNGTGTVAGADVTNIAVACTTTQFKVNVSVSGLAGGSNVVLTNNGGDALTVDGNKTVPFATAVNSGATYNVAVSVQPTSPAQTCTVGANASGTIGSGDVTVDVTCSTSQYTVGGTVTGLDDGKTLVITDSAVGTTDLTVTGAGGADVPFTFANPRNSGSGYNVSIVTQPAGQTCSVAGGSGTVGGGNITSVQINCATGKYALGGSVTGLAAGSEVILTDGTDVVHVNANGPSALQFPALSDGTAYNVQVATQPLYIGTPTSGVGRNQTCTVSNGTGTISGAAVSNVAVTCVTNKFKYSGQIAGLADGESITVTDHGTSPTLNQTKSVTGLPGSPTDTITFDQAVESGSIHTLTTTSPTAPIAQTCTVTNNGAGTTGGPAAVHIGNEAVNSAFINCVTNKYTVQVNTTNLRGGTIGLRLVAAGDGINTPGTVTSTGTSTPFAPQVSSGVAYTVAVETNPSSPAQTCTVTSGGSGTVTNVSPVVNVNCTTDTGTLGGRLSGLDNGSPSGSNTVSMHLDFTGVDGSGQPTVPGSSDLTLNANNPSPAPVFVFPAAELASGTTFTASITVDPITPPQSCRFVGGGTLSGGVCFNGSNNGTACGSNADCTGGGQCAFKTVSGTATGSDVDDIRVDCSTDKYFVGGTIKNFAGLQDCSAAGTASACGVELTITASNAADSSVQRFNVINSSTGAAFTFDKPLTSGDTFSIAVTADPTYAANRPGSRQQVCTVESVGSTGPVVNANILNAVVINCDTVEYGVTGTIANNEAASDLKLQLQSGSPVVTQGPTSFTAGAFNFPATATQVQSGDTFTLSIPNSGITTGGGAQLKCTIDGTGGNTTVTRTVENTAPASIGITCHRIKYKFAPALQFLATGTSVGLKVHLTNCGPEGCPADQTLSVTSAATDTTIQQLNNFADVVNGATYELTISTNPGPADGGLLPQNCTIMNGAAFSGTGTMPKSDLFGGVTSADVYPATFTNLVVRCGRGSTCDQIKLADPALVNGLYPLDIDGTGTAAYPARIYCDYTTNAAAGSSYSYLHVTNGIASSKQTDSNSCPSGYEFAVPRTLEHLTAMHDLFPGAFSAGGAIPGIYNDRRGNGPTGPDGAGTSYVSCVFNSSAQSGGTACGGGGPFSDWKPTSGTKWFLRNASHSEPNGDYGTNSWLGITGYTSGVGYTFNDLNGGYSTGTDYVCAPVNGKNAN